MPGFRRNLRTRRRIDIQTPSGIAKIIVVISLIAIIISSITLSIKQIQRDKEIAKKQQEVEQIIYNLFEAEDYENIQAEDIEVPDRVVNIVSIGDILCETELYESVYNKEDGVYNFDNIFTDTKDYIEQADLALASLETNFVEGQKYSGRGKYNSPLELLDSIKNLGIDVINTANNHSLDYGINGINATIDQLQARGISNVGTYKTQAAKDNILIKEIKGIKIAFLAYTYGSNVNTTELQENPYALSLIDKEKMVSDIQKSKTEGADFTFLLMHWGDVNSSKTNQEQQELATYLFENGADFILGTHPASIQPMEIRQNSQGKNVFIAYSTGNYISASEYTNSNIEMILDIQITKNPKTEETKLAKVTYTPLYLLDRGRKAEQRFKLLDVKKEIKYYESGNTENITEKEYEELLKALINIDNLIYNK